MTIPQTFRHLTHTEIRHLTPAHHIFLKLVHQHAASKQTTSFSRAHRWRTNNPDAFTFHNRYDSVDYEMILRLAQDLGSEGPIVKLSRSPGPAVLLSQQSRADDCETRPCSSGRTPQPQSNRQRWGFQGTKRLLLLSIMRVIAGFDLKTPPVFYSFRI
ncbi:unnamed protein product [Nesidiocoris tenuis]|uniref:Uncharacterized protein n=1 Tax=Nesidiocoris tenuis TaxID=355587 RepID=A0A6H5HT02_9HEMI|nr:unnamed protein product [Nesidiocoris tenuis]